MIIDAHNHPDWHGHDLARFLENMKKYNIDKTWLLSWECPEDEYSPSTKKVIPPVSEHNGPIPFERGLYYAERAPEKFVLGYAPDPRKADAIDKLEAACEIFGVKVYGELKIRMMFDNPDAIRVYRYCGKKRLPVVVHIDYPFESQVSYPRPNYWYGGSMDAFERAVAACPDTIFLGHAPGFWAHISGDDQYDKVPYPKGDVLPGGKIITMLDKYPNLYCDMSACSGHNALSLDKQFTKQFLITYQDRVLYARDYFDNVHQELLYSLELPSGVLEKILSKNAIFLTSQY